MFGKLAELVKCEGGARLIPQRPAVLRHDALNGHSPPPIVGKPN
jgi:hypothetical protein